MREIYHIQIFVGLAALVLVIGFIFLRRHSKKHQERLMHLEPDLEVVDKPEMIKKIPENEDFIPDANASWSNSNTKNDHPSRKIG